MPAIAYGRGSLPLAAGRALGAALLLLFLSGHALAQSAATVTAASGTVSAAAPDTPPRLVGRGAEVSPGDTVATEAASFARMRFTDGGEVALRPGSQFRIDQYRVSAQQAPAGESMLVSLLKGGLRTITGALARRDPQNYQLRTPTATIGVRGTDFYARLCEKDCAEEATLVAARTRRAIAPSLVARVAVLRGEATATPRGGAPRSLNVGAPVYVHELVETGRDSHVVLMFLDETRLSLAPGSRFTVEQYRFEPDRSGAGGAVLRLLQGGLRTFTGLLAAARPNNYRVVTPTATIGVRGTGWDLWCYGKCADPASGEGGPGFDGLYVSVWNGAIQIAGGQGILNLENPQAAVLLPDGTFRPITELPGFLRDFPAPRPDGVPFDPKLFGEESSPQFADPGTYFYFYEGRGYVRVGDRVLELSPGEAAYLSPDGERLVRLSYVPPFIVRDPYLGPPRFDPLLCRPG
ncbi:MAG: FecR family protein [Burkholderiales bacterium]|nr:FecR family protein [Burkholderiales bacterium]